MPASSSGSDVDADASPAPSSSFSGPSATYSSSHPASILASLGSGNGTGASVSTSMSASGNGNGNGKVKNKDKRKASAPAAAAPPAGPPTATSPSNDNDDSATATKKRRRVVVACQTCRRKKVKCRGLPNSSNTCDNCAAYGYRCTFDMDQDRSRGKYEILESKAETLLAALKTVAPHLAEQYERGQLNMSAPSGHVEQERGDRDRVQYQREFTSIPPPGAPAGPRLGPSPFEVATMLPPLSESHHHHHASTSAEVLPPIRSLGRHFSSNGPMKYPPPPSIHHHHHHSHLPHHGPMVPDLEDGRPRFFGRSSTLSHFHALDSRPPSISPPPPEHETDSSSSKTRIHSASSPNGPSSRITTPHSKRTVTFAPVAQSRHYEQPGRGGESDDEKDDTRTRTSPPSHSHRRSSPSPASRTAADPSNIKEWTVLPRPKPLYPSNSREWVHLLRRKNTVAVGRDDICTDEWATRYMLPTHDLVFHLLDDIYFPHLHPLLPILHPPTFRRDIANGRATHDTAFRGLVFCVMTISSRFSTDQRVFADPSDPHSAGDHWAAASRLYHQTFAASLINVQVLLLTSTYMHASIGPGSSWTILGVAIRALMDIGLHQERANVDFTPFDQEMRRRVFWAAFILDCIFAVCLGRPNAIRLEDCNVDLPLDVSDEVLGECEASGQPIAKCQEAGKEATSQEDAAAAAATAPDGAARAKSPPTPTVASGFRHMVKLNLVVHDVVQTLYTQRKAGSLPEWHAHPGLGPMAMTRDDIKKDEDEEEREDEDDDEGEGEDKEKDTATIKNPEYKAMALLCRRLDDWVAETPEHLRDPSTSPYKLQAGIVSCGTHDIRLYILKPFLPDPFLYKMLHPQCVYHARACLQTVIDLYENGHLNNMVFIFTQAFMSSVTFLLTVWQVTRHAKDLAPDATLIEKTARMMILAFDDRFCSALFRKAWRMLQRIATRVMPYMKDDEQRKRTQYWISAKGSAGGIPLPLQSYGGRVVPRSATGGAAAASGIPISNERGDTVSSDAGMPYKNAFIGNGNTAASPSDAPPQHGIPTHANGHQFPPRNFASPLFPWQAGGPNAPTNSGMAAWGSMRTGGPSSRPGSRPTSRHASRPTSPSTFAMDHWTRAAAAAPVTTMSSGGGGGGGGSGLPEPSTPSAGLEPPPGASASGGRLTSAYPWASASAAPSPSPSSAAASASAGNAAYGYSYPSYGGKANQYSSHAPPPAPHHPACTAPWTIPLMDHSFGDADGILGFGNLDMGVGVPYDAGEHARNMSMSSDGDAVDEQGRRRMNALYMDAAGGGGGTGGGVPGGPASGVGTAEFPAPIGGIGGGGASALGSSAGDTWQDYFWKFLSEVDAGGGNSSTQSNPSIPAESPYGGQPE